MTSEYIINHTIHFLSASLKDSPTSTRNSKLAAIEAVRTIFVNWQTLESLPPKENTVLPHSTLLIPRQAVEPVRYPTTTFKGGRENQTAITSKGVSQKSLSQFQKTHK